MELPFLLMNEAPGFPAVVVDGAFSEAEAPTLHLSHWPGNHTPAHLKHDLSSGSALAFIALSASEQSALLGKSRAWVNSHYDTDGTLALFALTQPKVALAHASQILDTAAAGDFFRWPNDLALALDAIVLGLAHDKHSPLAEQLGDLRPLERWQRCTEHLMGALPALLRGEIEPYRKLWEPVLTRATQDALALRGCDTQRLPELGLQVWNSQRIDCDPGRHALFQASPMERALVLSENSDGLRVRLIESTLTWFELTTRPASWRSDLRELAREWNAAEPKGLAHAWAWHAQPPDNPSPELWYGTAEQPAFAEHNTALGLSKLSAKRILGDLARHLGRAGA